MPYIITCDGMFGDVHHIYPSLIDARQAIRAQFKSGRVQVCQLYKVVEIGYYTADSRVGPDEVEVPVTVTRKYHGDGVAD